MRTGPIPHMTVTRVEGSHWSVQVDGTQIETAPSHYDAWEVLDGIERRHDLPRVAWALIDDGFELVDIHR